MLITNSVILNGGDAAILLSMINSIRRSFGEYTEIVNLCHQSDAVRRYYPELKVLPNLEDIDEINHSWYEKITLKLRLPRILLYVLFHRYVKYKLDFLVSNREKEIIETYASADIIISCGGGFLNDLYPKSLYKRAVGFYIAYIYGKKLIFYAQSMGPFWRPLSKKLAKSILERASLITLRDKRSLEILTSGLKIGNKNIFVTADAAHLLPSDNVSQQEYNFLNKEYSDQLLVGISVRDWGFFDIRDIDKRKHLREQYLKSIKDLCIYLISEYNAKIVFISSCQGRPEYLIDDSKVARQIVKNIPASIARQNIYISEEAYNPKVIKTILGKFDAFVGTRMHCLIFCLAQGVPCIGLEYEFKTRELFDELELQEYVVSLYSKNINQLNKYVDKLIKERNIIKASIQEKLPNLICKSKQNNELLKKVVRGIENEKISKML